MATYQTPPVQAPLTERRTELLTSIWLQWVQWLFSFVKSVMVYSGSTPLVQVTGFSYTMTGASYVLTLTPAGTLATGTVTMPATPFDGMPIEIASTQTITSFTLSANAGQTLMNAPTTLSAGVGVAYYYNAKAKTWYRRY